MSTPVNVRICLGTTCFVMGSGQLQSLFDELPAKFGKENVTVSAVRCFKGCTQSDEFSKSPFVMVDNELISSATPALVFKAVERHLNEQPLKEKN